MYFADFDLCFYHSGPLDAYEWQVPLRAVGWLEHPHEFPTGTAPNGLVDRIDQMAKETSAVYSDRTFRGLHECSHCKATGSPNSLLPGSHVNIFVPGISIVYAAPAAITHYIDQHKYLPPAEFIDAVQRCPDCDSEAYRAALCAANGGVDPPLRIPRPFKLSTRRIGTLIDVRSEHHERTLDGTILRYHTTYYTIDDGEQYVYVLKTRIRDQDKFTVRLNARIQFGLMYEEIGDDVLVTDDDGGMHILSLQERRPR